MGLIRKFARKLFPYRIKGVDNTIVNHNKKSDLSIRINGNVNKVIIEKAATLSNLTISVNGDGNEIVIGKNCRIYGPCSIVCEDGGKVLIGKDTGLRGVQILSRHASVKIGKDCMTSYGIIIRNHDSHCIIDQNTKQILNPAKDIVIGNHVWIAQNVAILKGANIGNNVVVGYGSVVTRAIPDNSICVGSPASVAKSNITWKK